MQADVKRAEIVLVQKVLRRTLLTNFIQTTAGPPLFWLPGKHNAATQSLLQKEQQKLEGYKVQPLASYLNLVCLWHTQFEEQICCVPFANAAHSGGNYCAALYFMFIVQPEELSWAAELLGFAVQQFRSHISP